jgi:hypothetical protein
MAPVCTGGTVARADSDDDARRLSGSNDCVLCPGWTVDEVPLAERPFLSFHDEQGLARDHEEVLLIGLPVIHRHRLTGPQHREVDPELRKVRLVFLETLELAVETTTSALVPRRLPRVEYEPTVPCRHKAVFGRFQRRLRKHEWEYVETGASIAQ